MTELTDTHGHWQQVDAAGLRALAREVGRRRAGRSVTGSTQADRVAQRFEDEMMSRVSHYVDAQAQRGLQDSHLYNVRIRQAADGQTILDVHGAGDRTGREVRQSYNVLRQDGKSDTVARQQLTQLHGVDPAEVPKALGIDHYLRVELSHMKGKGLRARMNQLGVLDNPNETERHTEAPAMQE